MGQHGRAHRGMGTGRAGSRQLGLGGPRLQLTATDPRWLQLEKCRETVLSNPCIVAGKLRHGTGKTTRMVGNRHPDSPPQAVVPVADSCLSRLTGVKPPQAGGDSVDGEKGRRKSKGGGGGSWSQAAMGRLRLLGLARPQPVHIGGSEWGPGPDLSMGTQTSKGFRCHLQLRGAETAISWPLAPWGDGSQGQLPASTMKGKDPDLENPRVNWGT